MAPSPAAVAPASRRWARSYPLAPRYRPPGSRCGCGRPTAHGCPRCGCPARPMRSPRSSWCTASRTGRAAGRSTPPSTSCPRQHIVALDLRGHGRSGGRSTSGVAEPADVAAAVATGARWRPRCRSPPSGSAWAAPRRCSRPVPAARWPEWVAVSAPAWRDLTSPAGVRLARWTAHRARPCPRPRPLSGTTVDPAAGEPGDLRSTVAAIAPGFVVIAHNHEPVFGPEHAEALFTWAGEPKALWWVPGGGHGRSMLTPDLLERVRVEVSERLGRAPAPRR